MPVRIAHDREVTDDSADIDWRLDQNVLLAREFRNPINFFTRLTLKTEVIKARFYFVLNNNQDEERILSGRWLGPQPDVVAALQSAIAHDREPAQ